jgi:hypothetical protein
MPLTATRLHETIDYNPETGAFRWIERRKGRKIFAGAINTQGYLQICIDGRAYLGHRLAWLYMTGEWPPGRLDHEDTDRANNRWRNLREATPTQNNGNMRRPKHNTSGAKGVSRDKDKWRSQIYFGGKKISLGRFDTVEQAHAAYVVAADQYFREFARPVD